MSLMLDEIHEQPEIIGHLVEQESQNIAELAEQVREKNIHLVIIAARGTSDNGARYGQYLLEIVNGIPVALAAPSVLTLYGSRLRMNNTLVIGISQSGQATDVAEYLEQSKAQGALTAAITNEPGSKIAEIVDCSILCHARKERSVAATKTYTATLAALYLLSAKLADCHEQVDDLLRAAWKMNEVFALEHEISERVQRYRYMEECFVVARGINLCTAFEAALKMAETSYVGGSAGVLHLFQRSTVLRQLGV